VMPPTGAATPLIGGLMRAAEQVDTSFG
jgi:hypothetical protein